MICHDCPHCWPVKDALRKKPVAYWCDLIADNVKRGRECVCQCKRIIFDKGAHNGK